MTCAQVYLQYKNWKGERVTREYFENSCYHKVKLKVSLNLTS